MTGPQPRGHWTEHNKPESWGILHPHRAYRVTANFRDYDGFEHVAGEQWTYLGFAFLPHDDGLSLFVSLDGEHEWHIRMQLRPEEQEQIVHDLSRHVVALQPGEQHVMSPLPAGTPSNRSTLLILAASLIALVLGFAILYVSGAGPRIVAPTESSLIGGLAGVAMLAGGAMLGLVGLVKLVRPATQPKRGSAPTP